MIGRGALSTPWLFRDTWSYLTTGTIPEPPTIEEKCQLMRDHFDNICRFRNERSAVMEFRKRVSWYSKRMHPCRMLKDAVRVINSRDDFERVIREFLDWRSTRGGDDSGAEAAEAPEELAAA